MAERSALNEDNLDVLQASSVTISRLLDVFGKKMLTKMSRMQRENMNEVRKLTDGVLTTVSSEIRHIEGVLSVLTRGMSGTRTVRSNARTTFTECEEKLNALTPDTDVIFNKQMFGMLLYYNSSNEKSKVFRKKSGSDVERALLSAQKLLFSLQPGDKKYSYAGKVGTLYSEFRFIIVLNAFFNMIRDTFQMFRSPTCPSDESNSSPSRNSNSSTETSSHTRGNAVATKMMKRPAWLSDKVTKDHINEARSFLEMPNQSRKSKVRRTPSPYDIACHRALRVYRLLGNYLHVRRGAVHVTFFQSLGYLLVPWSDHVRDFKQTSLKMFWRVGGVEESDRMCVDLDSVPCSEQCGIVLDPSTATAADVKNKMLLRQLFSDWPEMVLCVEHTVCVVSGNGAQCKHSGGEIATIRRLFNLIDVACDVCADYCGAGSRENILRGHRLSFQCIMIFATVFKAFCNEFMKEKGGNSIAASSQHRSQDKFPNPTNLEMHGRSLKDLIPGPSMQKNLLECRCLRKTRSEFNKHNHVEETEAAVNWGTGSEEAVSHMMDIQENEELGIGVL